MRPEDVWDGRKGRKYVANSREEQRVLFPSREESAKVQALDNLRMRRWVSWFIGLMLATTLVVLPSSAEAHPVCNIPPNWHDHYHFPYAHRDDWYYSFTTGNLTTTLYRHWWNADHSYYQSTSDCI